MHPRDARQAQLAAPATQDTSDFQARYALRAGAEGTIRQGVAVTGMPHARYRGLARTRLEHTSAAVALNLIRLHAFWNGHPLAGPAPATSPASNSPTPHEHESTSRVFSGPQECMSPPAKSASSGLHARLRGAMSISLPTSSPTTVLETMAGLRF